MSIGTGAISGMQKSYSRVRQSGETPNQVMGTADILDKKKDEALKRKEEVVEVMEEIKLPTGEELKQEFDAETNRDLIDR